MQAVGHTDAECVIIDTLKEDMRSTGDTFGGFVVEVSSVIYAIEVINCADVLLIVFFKAFGSNECKQ